MAQSSRDPARKVRCYDCGAQQQADSQLCTKCQSQFRRLCKCGAETSVYDRECPECGRALRVGRPRRNLVAKLLLPVVVVAGVGGLVYGAVKLAPRFAAEEMPPAAPALALHAQGDFEGALAALEAQGDLGDDARAWLALGECRHRLGAGDPLPALERALAIDSRLEDALRLLVQLQLRRGRADLAEARLEATPGRLSAEVLATAADVALHDIDPDVDRVAGRLAEALERGPPPEELLAAAVEARLRAFGSRVTSDELPTDARALVDALARSIGNDGPTEPADFAASAQVNLARGQAGDAEAETEQAFELLAGDEDVLLRVRLLLLRGRARLDRGKLGAGSEALLAAVAASPDAATAQRAVDHLAATVGRGAVVPFLRRATEADDPTGALHAVLAWHELAAGRTDAARAAAVIAVERTPGHGHYLRVLGDVEAARGDHEAAASAYAAALESAPGLLRTELRLATLPASQSSSPEGTRAALERLGSLRPAREDDDRALVETALLQIEAGDAEAAIATLERATALFPTRARSWHLLARAWLLTDRDQAIAAASLAISRARGLRPGDPALVAAEARVRLASEDPRDAALLCGRMIDTGKGTPELLRLRARSFGDLGRYDRAAADLRALLRDRPDAGADYLALVDVEFKAGNAVEARRLIGAPPPSLAGDAGRSLLALVAELNAPGAE